MYLQIFHQTSLAAHGRVAVIKVGPFIGTAPLTKSYHFLDVFLIVFVPFFPVKAGVVHLHVFQPGNNSSCPAFKAPAGDAIPNDEAIPPLHFPLVPEPKHSLEVLSSTGKQPVSTTRISKPKNGDHKP